jgi:hypothetical protein
MVLILLKERLLENFPTLAKRFMSLVLPWSTVFFVNSEKLIIINL